LNFYPTSLFGLPDVKPDTEEGDGGICACRHYRAGHKPLKALPGAAACYPLLITVGEQRPQAAAEFPVGPHVGESATSGMAPALNPVGGKRSIPGAAAPG